MKNTDNDSLELAWRLVEETGANVFLTGKAGTGKTTFLRRLKDESSKNIAVLAPTGIAALNAGGVTIHSFFQLSMSPYIPGVGQSGGKSRFDRYSKAKLKIIRSLDMIVIDEISMVRADILDAIDQKLRKYRNPTLPMGGVQLVMIGDLQQLPPVAKDEEWKMLSAHYPSPYFFDSLVLRSTHYETIELTKVYRQKDSEFIGILNAIRENRADTEILKRLNSRYVPGFEPDDKERYIRLMTHNNQARQYNDDKMSRLPGKPFVFKAEIEGEFPESMYPVDRSLTLKEGAQVMFVKNDSSGHHLYYNGLIGRIRSVSEDRILVETEESDTPVSVGLEMWENTEYQVDAKDGKMKEKVIGRFTQIPLRAAWAITVHKSQGLTFDRAIINVSSAFAHGQTYVALSRCRSLKGLVLEKPLSSRAIISDNTVTDYIGLCSERQVDSRRVAALEVEFKLRLQLELTDLSSVRDALEQLYRAMQESHLSAFPKITAQLGEIKETVVKNLLGVSARFQDQLRRMVSQNASPAQIQERISAACGYFLKELKPVMEFASKLPQEVDNKDYKKKFLEALEVVEYEMKLKTALMESAREKELAAKDYMRIRHEVSTARSTWTKENAGSGKGSGGKISGDVENQDVYDILVKWRSKTAASKGEPNFMVMGNRTLVALANAMPRNEREMLAVPGIGRKKFREYGEEILRLLDLLRPKA